MDGGKNIMKKSFLFKITSFILVVSLVIQSAGTFSMGWEQDAHMEINIAATSQFYRNYNFSEKYKNAQVNFDSSLLSPKVTSSSKLEKNYTQEWITDTAAMHIRHGGYSADESHIYVSVKHFYDPLALSGGKHELTDHYALHGWHVYEAVPATDWAVKREDNPYSLVNALRYYKKSMEIPYNASVSRIPSNSNYRDITGSPATLEEMRSMYAGKAMRGLGEVMHLVADMVQPAHVRNDAHPFYEITEQAVTWSVANTLKSSGRIDGLSLPDMGVAVEDLMVGLAVWTNRNFYSEDTLNDEVLGVKPRNWENPYPNPKMTDMTKKIHKGHITYFKNFGGVEIPMVRRVIGLMFDSYSIPREYALEQAKVLIPLAVSASTRTIDMFFPTLELTQNIMETKPSEEILEEAIEKGVEELKEYSYSAKLAHNVENDIQWQDFNLKINYSGPGEIIKVSGRKHVKVTDVDFIEGEIARYRDPATGEMKEGKPKFWLVLGAPKRISLGGDAVNYIVESGDALYIKVHAGVQDLKAPEYVFETDPPEITLEADRTTIMPGEKVEFKVEIENPPERYKLEWTFGDEEDDEENILPPTVNRKKEMVHTYSKEKEYTATVKIIDTKRNIVRAKDSIDISSYMGELAGPWEIVMEIQEESKFFRAMIIAIMKGIVNLIIAPIMRAFGEEPGNMDDEIDKFTFVGTTLTYSLDLRKSDDSETVYEGPLVFVGSNTDYIEASEDITGMRLEIRKGEIVMVGLGYNEEGQYVEFDFLTKGKMLSPGTIEGEFNMDGFMSGTWTAVKK